MLKAEKRNWLTFALCLLAVFLVFVVVSFFVPFYPDICSKNENSGKEECAAHYVATFVLLSVAEFLEAHDGAIVAIATIFIAWFTFQLRSATVGLKDSTDKLWSAGENQIALARDEFNATHRPRVSIRRMSANVAASDKAGIEFTIINTGEISIANCIWNANILLLSEIGAIHWVPIYLKKTSSSYKKPLKVGEGTVRRVLDVPAFDPADILSITRKKKFLHVVGFVAYTDAAGTTRRMGFFRYYDSDRQRFRKIDDPEYEYQD